MDLSTLPEWGALLLTLLIAMFGREWLGQYLNKRQALAQAEDTAAIEREASLLDAVVDLVRTQSRELTALLQEALKANQTLANNLGSMAVSMDGSTRDSQHYYLAVRDALGQVNKGQDLILKGLQENSQYVAILVKAIGQDFDQLRRQVEKDQRAEAAIVKEGNPK